MNKENIFIFALILSIVVMSVNLLYAASSFQFQKTTVIDEDRNNGDEEGVEDAEPQMAVDSKGDIYITYGNGARYNYFFLQKSTNGGDAFSKQIIERDNVVLWDPLIAVDPDDNIFIVFEEEFKGDKYPGTMCMTEIKIMKSVDGGNNFSEPIVVAPQETLDSITGFSIDPNGYIYIFLKRSIVYLSKDGGQTFSKTCVYDGQDVKNIGATIFTKTMYYVDKNNVFVAWFDNRNHEINKDNASLLKPTVMDLFYSRLQENDEFGKNIKICTIDPAQYQGALYSVGHTFLKKNNGNLIIYFAKWYVDSVDNGKTWSSPEEVVIQDITAGRGGIDKQHFQIDTNEVFMFSNGHIAWSISKSKDGGITFNESQSVIEDTDSLHNIYEQLEMDRVFHENKLYITWKWRITNKATYNSRSQLCFTKGSFSDDLDGKDNDSSPHSSTSQGSDSGGSCFIGGLIDDFGK